MWKGLTEHPKIGECILFEELGELDTGVYDGYYIRCLGVNIQFNKIDKWMYEEEAKKILYEYSWPHLNYEEDL